MRIDVLLQPAVPGPDTRSGRPTDSPCDVTACAILPHHPVYGRILGVPVGGPPGRHRRRVQALGGTRMKSFLAVVALLLVVALGVAGVVLGEADDSPGLQGLGVLLVIGAVAVGVRIGRRVR
ncbi:hypothetical protein [Geodermatophilus sabuli]|nr:hypothetical protein [Geodermatophilus sabuli]MBB3084061.1 hypothetical protein [Geodermatophilus sabuli]